MLTVAESHDPESHQTSHQTKGWSLSFPTLLPSPQAAGLIRRQPEDFRVVERLDVELASEGEHVYFDIEKREANTAWVAWQLSERLGLREQDIGYAGRKDRHAITRQWFSAYLPGKPIPAWDVIKIEGVRIHGVRRHRQKLREGQLQGNHFEIRVETNTSPDARADIESRLGEIKTAGFPNYFGAQRFGRDGANLDLADKLLVRRGKLKGDRGMAISAARAWLFNLYLADQVSQGCELRGRTGPLIGKVRDPQPGEDSLDEHMQQWVSGLRHLGSKAAERELLVVPKELRWRWSEGAVSLSFCLPAGAFATSLLSELFILKDLAR